MDYVDLYLIHRPIGDQILETYDAFLTLKEKGLAKYVSNCHNQKIYSGIMAILEAQCSLCLEPIRALLSLST